MKRTKLHIDQFLYPSADPYEFGPADIGTDRPLIDPDAADAAERNARATNDERRRLDFIYGLMCIDPNGVWTDSDSRANGLQPLTHDEAAEIYARLRRPQ